MSTAKTLQIATASSEETEKIGEAIGRQLCGGELLLLTSDVGGGKTTLVRGIAKGAGSTDAVSSPSFTVMQVYKTPTLRLLHYDFYRLEDAGILQYELHDELQDSKAVCIIEWSDIVRGSLQHPATVVTIKKTSDSGRAITVAVAEETPWLQNIQNN